MSNITLAADGREVERVTVIGSATAVDGSPATPVVGEMTLTASQVTKPNTDISKGSISSAVALTGTAISGQAFNVMTVDVETIGATSFDVYASVDGTHYVGPLLGVDKKTNANYAGTGAPAQGAVSLVEYEGKYLNWRIDLVGTGASLAHYLLGTK